jgi:hypothetical protein
MQSDIETKAYNIYLEQMITANEGFWRDAPLFADPSKVIRIQENFELGAGSGDGWREFADGFASTVTAAHNIRGGAKLTTGGTDNDQLYYYSYGSLVQFNDLVPVWFEVVLNVETALATMSMAVGVSDSGNAVTAAVPNEFLTDAAGAMISDHDGAIFHINEASTGQVQFHVSNETVQANSNLGTVTAGTDFRVGFKWDGEGTLTPWMNGRPYATASFTPASSLMNIVLCVKTHAGSVATIEAANLNVIIDRRNDSTLV